MFAHIDILDPGDTMRARHTCISVDICIHHGPRVTMGSWACARPTTVRCARLSLPSKCVECGVYCIFMCSTVSYLYVCLRVYFVLRYHTVCGILPLATCVGCVPFPVVLATCVRFFVVRFHTANDYCGHCVLHPAACGWWMCATWQTGVRLDLCRVSYAC